MAVAVTIVVECGVWQRRADAALGAVPRVPPAKQAIIKISGDVERAFRRLSGPDAADVARLVLESGFRMLSVSAILR